MNFTYDTENRLISASGAKSANLSYDPLGRLWEVSAPTGTTRFLYDGDALVAEYDNVGILKHRYVHGNGVDQPLVWYDGAAVTASTRRHLFANWQGSISAVTDSAGNAMHVNAYDAYGIPNDTNVGRFQYTGQILLTELGMYHYKARIYSPYLGRFLQTDPIGYEDQFNLYAYVGNDPVGRIDPTGMYECDGEKDCAAAAAATKEINTARKNLKRKARAAGKDLKRARAFNKAAAQLDDVSSTLGTEGDGNGLTIQTGTVSGGYGAFSGNTITLDVSKIGGDPNASLGSTLAHEGKHAFDKSNGISQGFGMSKLLARELNGFSAGALVDIGLGRTGRHFAAGKGLNSRAIMARRMSSNLRSYCRFPGCDALIENAIRNSGVAGN